MPTRKGQSALLFAILVSGLGCRRTEFCAGAPTCFGTEAVQCKNVPGCTPTPGCVLDPILGIDCTSPATEAECSKIADCTWSAGLCRESCSQIPDQPTCAANRGTRSCFWSACSGRAKACRLYSPDECPISPIGCYVDPGT